EEVSEARTELMCAARVSSEQVEFAAHVRSGRAGSRLAYECPLVAVEAVGGAIEPKIGIHQVDREVLGDRECLLRTEDLQISPGKEIFMAELVVVRRRELIVRAAVGRTSLGTARDLVFGAQDKR